MVAAGAPARASDGRTARSARTRDAVVEAYLELVEDGDPRPTARSIAERAGVSLRSVYVRFEDRDDIAVAAAQRQWERIVAIARPIPLDAPFATRVSQFIAQRTRVLEMVAPVRRAAEHEESLSHELPRLLDWARNLARDEIAAVFAPELALLSGAARTRRLDALDVVCSTNTWDALRRHRRLPVAGARRVITEMIEALLPEEEPDGSSAHA
jgi:TetR/AcrR family transcriptional regulator of autoinduction and epiphytic fitness